MHIRLQLTDSVSVCRRMSTTASSDAACRHAKLWKLPKTGNINNLTLVEQTLPAPSAGQVTVAVRAVRRRCSCPFHVYKNLRSGTQHTACMQVGINFADVFTCLGLYAAAPKEAVTPGLEVSCTAVAVCQYSPTLTR